MQLDKSEIYLYGTLFALVREQLAAISKLTAGQLGIWGKMRFEARTKEITKFVAKIFEHKGATRPDPIEDMLADVSLIESDTNLWADVDTRQADYLRTLLRSI